jgi:hypothetical protein
MTTQNPYTTADAGCYVDACRGIYATDAIVAFAVAHGADITHDPTCETHAETCDASTFAGCTWQGEYEDEADAYMNARYPVAGHSWGRQPDTGDWGLWADEDPTV